MRSLLIDACHRESLTSAVMMVEISSVRSQIFGVAAGVESPLVVPGWLGPATMNPASASTLAIQAMPSTREPEPCESITNGNGP